MSSLQSPVSLYHAGSIAAPGETGPDAVTRLGAICRHQLICVLLVALALCMLAGPVHARSQVLIVFDEDKDLPGLAVINRNLQEGLRGELREPIEFYSESLALSRFNRPGYQDVLREYFRRKYQGRRPDLIFAVMEPALDFVLQHRDTLFPGVPIVFCGADPVDLDAMSLPDNVTGVVMQRTFAPTLEIALQLQPETRNVFVIGGRSRFDRQIQAAARRELQGFDKRVSITWLTELPMQQLLSEVAALPRNSVIYYLTLFVDGADEAFIPHEVLSRVAQVANAPVYVAVDQYVGRGAVGGHVYSVANLGQQAAAIAVRILRGEAPSSIPVTSTSAYENVFDWLQLERWRIDEDRLPMGSQVNNRPASIWYLYKWYILAGAAAFLLQSALVIGLFASRAQRRRAELLRIQSEERRLRAEDEVRKQRDELAHALRVTTLGEMTASFAHELGQPLTAITMNAEAAQQLLARHGTESRVDEALDDVIADASRASETLRRLRALFRKEAPAREREDVNAAIEDVLRLLDSEMRHRQIRTQFIRGAGSVYVIGDAVQLRQVLINLLVNAAEAISAGGEAAREIQIESRRLEAGRVEILIRDAGVGVEESELEQIFEHFVSSKPQGLGMGLAISRSILEAHSGTIWATRNEGRGLTMHVQLPVADADDEPAEQQSGARATSS
jgi:signal transduction histidine kinase